MLRIPKNINIRFCDKGFSLIEMLVAVVIALIGTIGAYSLLTATEKHYKSSIETANMYDQARIAMEKIYKDMSETSNETIVIYGDAVSFASARDSSGVFQTRPYNWMLKSVRPSWQKAVVYYTYGSGDEKKLYRKEIAKIDWSTNYNPQQAINGNGEVIAENVVQVSFSYSAETLMQAHTLQVNLELAKTRDRIQVGALPTVSLNTRVPMMNRRR